MTSRLNVGLHTVRAGLTIRLAIGLSNSPSKKFVSQKCQNALQYS